MDKLLNNKTFTAVHVGIAILISLAIYHLFTYYSQKNKLKIDEFAGTTEYFGDPVLTFLYRRIHLLERIARGKVSLNNDPPGGDHGVPKEAYILEKLHREMNKLKRDIREIIKHGRRKPHRPVLYSDNPMPGIPSVPGTIHPYYAYQYY